jgi:RecA-family ATPase
VLIIATEDDFERVLRPRLDVAGADITRCLFMVSDSDTLQGQPLLPHNRLEVEVAIKEHHVWLVYIDPWVSSVSGGLRLQNTQDARRAIDPLVSMARAAHCSVLAVAHPNRGEGDPRARVGLSAVLRQAARAAAVRNRTPDDDTKLITGIEKPTRQAEHQQPSDE